MQELFDARKIATDSFNNFKKVVDTSYPPIENPEVQKIQQDYTKPKKEDKYLMPAQPIMLSTFEEQQKPSFEKKNYNVDELYTQLSNGEMVKNFPTYTPGIDNYEAFAQSQSKWDKWVNGATKALSQTLSAVAGGTVGTVYGLGAWIKEGSFSATYDNDFKNWLDDYNEKLRYTLPNYQTKEERDMSYGERLGTANFWADDFLGGLSFTVGAIGTELAWAYATAGIGNMARRGLQATKAASMAKSLAVEPLKRMTRNSLLNLKPTITAGKIGEGLNLVRSTYTGAAYESGFEARSYMREMRQNFEKDFQDKKGYAPTEEDKAEFEKQLESTANHLFAFNLAVVGTSNLATFGSLVGVRLPKVSPDNWVNRKIFGTGVQKTDGAVQAVKANKLQKLGQYTYSLGKGAVVEGAFQEGLQAVGSRTAKSFLESGYYGDESASYGKAFIKSLEDVYGTEEGREEIYTGMLIGAFTGNALGLLNTKTLNHEFKDVNKRAQLIEENFGKNANYSTKAIIENTIMANRVNASKKAEENAERKGDLLGGQQARTSLFYAQLRRANNLDYYDQTIEETLGQIDLIDSATLAKENKISIEEADRLKEELKGEYQKQSERFQKVEEFSKYFIGNKLSKEEKELVAKTAKEKGITEDVTSDMLKEALSYELFMGESAYEFSDDMLKAFQNEVQNLLGSSRIKNAISINDVLTKSSNATKRQANKVKKDLQKATEEFNKIENEYRQVENIMTKATSVEERQSIQARLSDLLLKKEELTKRKEQLTAEFNTIYNSAKLENPFGEQNQEEFILEEDILSVEDNINTVLEKLNTLEKVDPQKAEKLRKLLQEYEKSVGAFKKYSQRTSQMISGVGLRGKKGIFTDILYMKSPNEATKEMIKGLLDTHLIKTDVLKEEFEKLGKSAKEKQTKQGVDIAHEKTEEKVSLKSYIQQQIEKHPYLFSQIGEDIEGAMPTKEEVDEYYDLVEKDLVEQQPLTDEEKARFEELNIKMANWQLLEAIGDGVTLAEMIEQDVLNSDPQQEVFEEEEITEEVFDTIIENAEGEKERNFSILQTIQNVFVKKYASNYYFSHITPKTFLDIIGQTGEVEVYEEDKDGNILSSVDKVRVEDLNDRVKVGSVISFGNTSIKVVSGMRLRIPTKNFEQDYKQFFPLRLTKSGFSVVFDSTGKPMVSDFKDVDTYSPNEIYKLTSGDTLVVKVDMNDSYNQSLSEEDLEANMKISLYDQNGNKVADLKADYLTEGQVADEKYNSFLALRAKVFSIIKSGEVDGIIELGEVEVSTIFLGAPNLQLDEQGREMQFEISPEQVVDYGYWNGATQKTVTKDKTKARVDLLKGINKDLPIVIVKEGETLVAYPVSIVKNDSKKGDEIVDQGLTAPQLAIALNKELKKAGKRTVELYYYSVDEQNMYNADGTPTETLQGAIDLVNSIKTKVDYKTTWFTPEHTKEQLRAEATVNINLEEDFNITEEGVKFLSPKIAINLDMQEYKQTVQTQDQVSQEITDYLKEMQKLGSLGNLSSKFAGSVTGNTFKYQGATFRYIIDPTTGDVYSMSASNKSFESLVDSYNSVPQEGKEQVLDKIKSIATNRGSSFFDEFGKTSKKVAELKNKIESDFLLKSEFEDLMELTKQKQDEAKKNKKC